MCLHSHKGILKVCQHATHIPNLINLMTQADWDSSTNNMTFLDSVDSPFYMYPVAAICRVFVTSPGLICEVVEA